MITRLARVVFASLLLGSWAGCIDAPSSIDAGPEQDALVVDASRVDAGPPTAIFVAPRDGEEPSGFFDLPWPSDARLTPNGTPDLAGFPGSSRGLIRTYRDAIERDQRGFSTMGAIYFRFTADVRSTSLPRTLDESVSGDASVFVVPLGGAEEGDPPRLERHPIVAHFEPRQTRYWPGGTLALRPADGFPLLPDTLYAAVVTRRVKPAVGGEFRRSDDLEALLAGDERVASLSAIYEPALEALEVAGIDRDEILSIAVFRTQDPTALLAASVDWVHEALPPPVVLPDAWELEEAEESASYETLLGRYEGAPTFQEGTSPYASTGGAIHLGDDGHPILVDTFEARFALTVPTSPMPDTGYPIVLYGHGTGGDYRSFIDDDTAELVAAEGFAAMGIDAPIHGERAERPDGTLFFNVGNPDAIRTNPLQAALDHAAQSVVASTMEVPIALVDRDDRAVFFDPDRIFYIGHSQGALVGPLFFGVDPHIQAALFSAGGTLIGHTLLDKVAPLDIPALVRSLLSLPGSSTEEAFEQEGFTIEHPIVTLLQGWIDVSDPGNYAPLAVTRPRSGVRARSVIVTEGFRDTYVSPAGMEALATAFRVPILAPVGREIAGLQFLGIRSEEGAAHANLGGGATGGLFQFPTQGHFGFFRVPSARARVGAFFGSLLVDGVGTIPAP